jgi:hypothetical protein
MIPSEWKLALEGICRRWENNTMLSSMAGGAMPTILIDFEPKQLFLT